MGLAALLITVGLCIAALGLVQLYAAKEHLGTWRVYDNAPSEKVDEVKK